MTTKRDGSGRTWVPLLMLHDAARSGVPVYVNGFWIRSFAVGGRGTVLVFIDGSDLEVKERPEEIGACFGR